MTAADRDCQIPCAVMYQIQMHEKKKTDTFADTWPIDVEYNSSRSKIFHTLFVVFLFDNCFILCWSSKMGILEKISEIEKEIARTQKNKGTF